MKKNIRTVNEYIRNKALSYLGLIDSQVNPQQQADRLTFVNDINEIRVQKLKEYNVWYSGESDEIMNFYTKKDMIDYNTDPIYNRNKHSYFWSIVSTEQDVKATHSGQPRNIVDTLVNIVGYPKIGHSDKFITERIQKILDDNDFNRMFLQEQLPLTLVEGWGAYKINYDNYLRDTPIILYYKADSVDFIYKSNQLIAIVFRDYYQNEKGDNFILFETRRLETKVECDKKGNMIKNKNGLPKYNTKLIIEKEMFRSMSEQIITPCDMSSIPELRDVSPVLEIDNYKGFLAQPCIIYKDNNRDVYGRSIFTGKIDLFDDLDQCLSQSSNSVRRSTVQEYFNRNYLERDEHSGLPVQPKSYDRKYIMYEGGVDANGATAGQQAVLTTQPAINFAQYDAEATHILLQIISGVMSPATLGIDIAKKDNAEAQREKEKVTVFTRKTIVEESYKTVRNLINESLCAWELQNKGEITVHNYDEIYVKFDEFADSSFEKKLETVLQARNGGLMTPELAVETLYKDSLSQEDKDKIVEYIKKAEEQEQNMMNPEVLGQIGTELGGNNNNPYNEYHEKIGV